MGGWIGGWNFHQIKSCWSTCDTTALFLGEWMGVLQWGRILLTMWKGQERRERWTDGWMDERMGVWMGEWVDGWMDGWINGWVDGWVAHFFITLSQLFSHVNVFLCGPSSLLHKRMEAAWEPRLGVFMTHSNAAKNINISWIYEHKHYQPMILLVLFQELTYLI